MMGAVSFLGYGAIPARSLTGIHALRDTPAILAVAATWMSPIPPSQHGALDRRSECRAATGCRIWLCLYEADERDGPSPP